MSGIPGRGKPPAQQKLSKGGSGFDALGRWHAEIDAAGGSPSELASVRARLQIAVQQLNNPDGGIGPSLLLGQLAAAGVGGPKDEALAESCFLPAAEGGDTAAMYCLAELYIEMAEQGSNNLDLAGQVDAILGNSSAARGGEGGGPEVVDKAQAMSVQKGIRQLVKHVRNAKQAGRPIKHLQSKKKRGEGRDPELWLKTAAERGNTEAMVLYGNLLITGRLAALRPQRVSTPAGKRGGPGVIDVEPVAWGSPAEKKKWEEAGVDWYQKAAEKGQADAWYNLAFLGFEGRVLPKDDSVARACLEKAVDLGDPDALYVSGMLLLRNDEKDQKAERMLISAADFGHAEAAYFMAMTYRMRGDLVAMKARLEQASEAGYAEADFCLGDCCYNGSDGFVVNFPVAVRHYAAAAKRRHAGALTSLGAMIYNGMGVPKDYEKAFQMYQLAAECGSTHAMRNLASMHLAGEGCEKDEKKAQYLIKVADKGDAEVKAQDAAAEAAAAAAEASEEKSK